MCPLPSNASSTTNPKSAKKQEEKKKKKKTKEKPNKKEVIITVYVESQSPPIKINKKNSNGVRKIKPRSLPKKGHTSKSQGYDRRAQLLAYSKELRNSGSQPAHWPNNTSRPKAQSDGKVLTTPVRLRRTKSRVECQKIVPVVDVPCSAKCKNGNMKRKSSKNSEPHFFMKLKGMLKGMCNESHLQIAEL